MKETTQLRKSFMGGYRREDVQEYFDELYEDAEKKYKELADEHDRLAQENLLLRQWLGETDEDKSGMSLADLQTQAAFDLPEGVYQFDPHANKVVDLTRSNEPVEFQQVAAEHSFSSPERSTKPQESGAKLSIVPAPVSQRQAKKNKKAKATVAVSDDEKESAQTKTVAKEATAKVQAEATKPASDRSEKIAIDSKPPLDYEQKVAAEKKRQAKPKRFYVKGRPAASQAEAVESGLGRNHEQHAAGQAGYGQETPYQAQGHAAQAGQYSVPNAQAAPFHYQPPYQGYQANPYAYPNQAQPSPQYYQAPPAFYQPATYPGQSMHQAPAVDPNLLARLDQLEAELQQTKAQLDFANGLLKDLINK